MHGPDAVKTSPHRLLSVVGAVAQAQGERGEPLTFYKYLVDFRSQVSPDPQDKIHCYPAKAQPKQGGDEQRQKYLEQSLDMDDTYTEASQCCTDETPDQGMRRAGGDAKKPGQQVPE